MRNPYHDYSGLDELAQKLLALDAALHNGQVKVPSGSSLDFVADPYWYGNKHGFNIALTKDDLGNGNLKSCPSEVWDGSVVEYLKYKDAKFRKNGTLINRTKGCPEYDEDNRRWKYKNYSGNYNLLSSDIQLFLEFLNEYRQVSTGLLHKQRQIVVADFDEDYKPDTLSRLDNICQENNIPHYTYLEHHLDSNHYQVGWILDEAFNYQNYRTAEEELYKCIIVAVAKLFGSDAHFKGWHIKNPSCIHLTDTVWFNDTVSKKQFCKAMLKVMAAMVTDADEVVETSAQNSDTEVENDSKDEDAVIIPGLSRNDYLINHLRDWIWKKCREDGDMPSLKDALSEAKRIGQESGQLSGKGSQSSREIDSVARSVYDRTKKNYKKTGMDENKMLLDSLSEAFIESTGH